MEINIRGKTIRIPVRPLGVKIDSYLQILFTRFLTNPEISFNEFIEENFDDLRKNILDYLDTKIGIPFDQDFLFNNLTVIGNVFGQQGRLTDAQQFWNAILNIALEWEQARKARVHKGSIYYFWSQFAIFQGELDKGFLLIHSAYEEDVVTQNSDQPHTPAFLTVSLDYKDDRNLLFHLVRDWANYLSNFLDQYNIVSVNPLPLDVVRTHFLNSPPNRDTLFMFTYTLARFFTLESIPQTAVQGTFASLLELNSLFDLVLVIDSKIFSSITNPQVDDWKFINLANTLLIQSGISNNRSLNATHLSEVNQQKYNSFEVTVSRLLDQTFIYSDKSSPSKFESDIAIAYILRNHSAHKISSYPIICERFKEIQQSIFNVLFLAIQYS